MRGEGKCVTQLQQRRFIVICQAAQKMYIGKPKLRCLLLELPLKEAPAQDHHR
ncbi:hypothetical protein D3C80_1675620 [compost metagenome]